MSSIFRKLLVVFCLLGAQWLQAATEPMQLVQQTADKVLQEVTANKVELNKDPSGIYALVGSFVLPHFDFEAMTQSAMGKYWRRASSEQKAAIVRQFRELLVRTYAVALLNYSGQKIEYLPVRESGRDGHVQVMTKVAEANGGPEIPVNYWLEQKGEDWKVYDVVIDGVSLVSNYRTSFAGQIRRSGIDGLIKQLSNHNEG
ncbi:MAG: ABC transporter substrate-binding protein [Chromatiales bacterium]|jgi:phospholipid transport system substrate-binding protein